MQAYDEWPGRLGHLHSGLAREKLATGTRPEEEGSHGTETWPGLRSPAQIAPQADTLASLPPHRSGSESPLMRRLSKTAFGLGIVAVVGFAPLQTLLQTSSVEAVVNARVITLRAPIDGEVHAGLKPLDFGTSIARGDVLLRIVNRRADRSRVDDLIRQIEQMKDERPGIMARLTNAGMLLKDLTEQTRLFVEARILQLEVRQDELRAEVAAAHARSEEAKTTLDRFTTLASKGWRPRAQLDQAQRDASVAEKLEAVAEKRLEAAGVELATAQRGVFVGGGNNDRPRYMQRADQLEQQVSKLVETLAEHDQRMIRLNGELVKEKARHAVLAAADLIAPVEGSMWEILTAPEEQVHRGQDVLRVLDCGGAVVTAVASESLYKSLRVGSPARFQPLDRQEKLSGKVIRLTGASVLPVDLAIQPSAPMGDSYHVTIGVPKLVGGQGCMVGHAGRAFFSDAPFEAITATTPVTP
jgi:multidrug resistance efflux pump